MTIHASNYALEDQYPDNEEFFASENLREINFSDSWEKTKVFKYRKYQNSEPV